jgi:hypothetical protein
MTAALHCPRVVAVPLAAAAERRGPVAERRLSRHLLRWETLSRLPTRQITGHFVVVRARR